MSLNLRNNSLIVALTAVYLAVLAMGVITFDRQFYQTAKRELLRSQYLNTFPIDNPDLENAVQKYLEAKTQREESQARGHILKEIDKFFQTHKDAPILSIRLEREGKTLIEERHASPRDFNTFRNSLVLRDYQGIASKRIQPSGAEKVLADILFAYTSPVGFAPLEDLTRRYWVYLALLAAALTAIYLLMLRFLILPLKKVTEAIQQSREGVARFVAKPRTRLERLYNAMARDALLSAMTAGPANPSARQLRLTLNELLEFLTPRIAQWFGFGGVWLFDLAWEGPAKLALVRQLPAEGKGVSAWESVAPAFTEALARNLRTSWESKTPQVFHAELDGGARQVFAGVVPTPDSDSALRALVMLSRRPLDAEERLWRRETAERVYRQVVGLVERQIGQSRELLREKSEATISLSRNLGHDLTNIIATNKLELLTVRTLLDGDPAAWLDRAEQTAVLRESLTRLLDNTRGLQQIVNLYRAYEYLRAPRYERAEINLLVQELIDIFRLSMSAPVDIVCDLAPDLPALEIEPRLIKLAMLNLLSNAQDAICRLPSDMQRGARIVVQTLRDPNREDAVLVRVSDTGPGIRTPEGNLAAAEEIDQVFELGYTTKAGEGGEGLGLNWVRTILTEFHPGELIAYNRPEGGATFQFRLPAGRSVPRSHRGTE